VRRRAWEIGADSATASRFDADTLQHIRRELALYVGPIAEFVLSRAARLSRSTDELLVKVAEEIESPQQREEFLRKMNSPVSSDISLAASAPAPMSRSGNTPPVDDIDAHLSKLAPAIRSGFPPTFGCAFHVSLFAVRSNAFP